MAKKSLFGRLADAFKEEDDLSEDIDKDVEASVIETLSAEMESLDGNTVLSAGRGSSGDTVFIFGLTPVFDMMGGRDSRAADGLLEICDRKFELSRKSPKDSAAVQGDNFIMRFDGVDKEQGYHRAAILINEIGTSILSDRFQEMDVPEILVAADVNDITNEDGTVNAQKIVAVKKAGGVPIEFQQIEGLPEWAKLAAKNMANRWFGQTKTREDRDISGPMSEERVFQDQVVVTSKDREEYTPDYRMVEVKHKPKKQNEIRMVEINPTKKEGKPDWMSSASSNNDSSESPPIKRSPIDRRAKRIPIGDRNRRKSGVDRRGRGY